MGYIERFIGEGEPLKIYAWRLYHDVATGPHTLPCYLLIYVRENQSIHIWDRNTDVVKAGDMLLIHPGQTHRYVMPNGLRIYNCLFEETMTTAPYLRELPTRIAHIPLSMQKRVESLLAGIAAKHVHIYPLCDPALVKAQLRQLLDIYRDQTSDGASPEINGVCNYILQAINLLQENRELNIPELAETIGLNQDYLNRIFKKEVGMTLIDYKILLRIMSAVKLLENSDAAVSEIAEDVGYSSNSLFCAQFKRVCKMTPVEYRKYLQEKWYV